MQCAAHYPWFTRTLIGMIPKSAMKTHDEHGTYTHNRVMKRIELGKTRNDLIEGLLMKQDELQISQRDLESNASLLIIAGSETTATLLSGVLFLLLTNPDCLSRLKHEVRSTFAAEADITIASVSTLPYMLACLDEALRCYPPIASGLPRVVAKGGKTLCGKYVPEDVSLQSLFLFVSRREYFVTNILCQDSRRRVAMGNMPLQGQLRRAICLPTGAMDRGREREVCGRQARRHAAFLLRPA